MAETSNIQLFSVGPSMPDKLEFLERLSFNLWWSWNPDAVELFRRIDVKLWRECEHNPFAFFCKLPQQRLDELVSDKGFMTHYRKVRDRFDAEVKPVESSSGVVAYFSLEYGIHESIRLYAGGLGCLAGDHLKSASDLGLPMVAVGLLYRLGYYQQYLNTDGWQQEACLENENTRLPIKKAMDGEGKPVRVSLPMPGNRLLIAEVWRADIGRVPLFLLDANLPENPPDLRGVTSHLYDGDRQVRLRQEILLGVGGYLALRKLGFDPAVCHLNEGHAAFAAAARISELMKEKGLGLNEAAEIVRRTSVFTTHTPVPAGNETFSLDLAKEHFSALHNELGIDPSALISWGSDSSTKQHEIVMTVLALRLSQFANGVSKLHGRVSREMWRGLWPNLPTDEVPIGSVTNGVHLTSWLSVENAALFDKYLGTEWRSRPGDEEIRQAIFEIPNEELWRAHGSGRSRLVRNTREIAEKQYNARNATRAEVAQVKSVLNYDALTIGFARRFAAYKRATLLLKEPERLMALLTDKDRPVQIVFAGKAHPDDDIGKGLIRDIVHFTRRPEIRNRMIFLENYDINIARYLVQGVDVWLNTPRRPQEASGTSGMKAAINGTLNLSILDGWWDEAYSRDCGWAIGDGEEYSNLEYQDSVESHALYNLLENEVIPMYYDRTADDLPPRWIKMMKSTISMAFGSFSSHRMVSQYNESLYGPATREHDRLMENNCDRARALVAQGKRLHALWEHVRVEKPVVDRDIAALHVGDKFNVTVSVRLGELKPEEVNVQVYYGPVGPDLKIVRSHSKSMTLNDDQADGVHVYNQEIECESTGRYGLTARVIPAGDDWKGIMPGFITWADGS